MTTCDNADLVHLEQVLEWAEQSFQHCTDAHENAERQYQKIITTRRKRNYTAGDYCDWSEYGTKTLHSLDVCRHRAFDLCFISRADRDKAKKELDDYMASIVLPCAEESVMTNGDDKVQGADAPVTTCCPVGEQDTCDSSSSDDEKDVE